MLLGKPSKFAFLIERVPEWETGSYKNGLMFVMVNDEIYPKKARTTTLNSELSDILSPDSAFADPITDKELYVKSDKEIIGRFSDEENDLWRRCFIPFHEIEDSGHRFYVISDGASVKILVCKMDICKTELVNKLEMPIKEYEEVRSQVTDFYNSTWF